jgi:hypothetical protein
MSNLPLEVVEMLGGTIAKVVPITIVLALVFSVLTHFWACNPGTPWWRKRELVTDICYWFFVPRQLWQGRTGHSVRDRKTIGLSVSAFVSITGLSVPCL